MANNRRDAFLSVLGRVGPKGLPVWEIEFHLWDAFGSAKMVLGESFARLSQGEQTRAIEHNADIIARVAEELHMAAVTMPASFWYESPGQLAYFVLPGEARYDLARAVRRRVGDSMAIVANTGGVISASYDAEFCAKLYEQPEEIDAMCRGALSWGLANGAKARDAGCDAVFTASDIADNHGLFFSPPLMDRFILPYVKQWSAGVKAMGLGAIMHTDGNIEACVGQLAETGLDALQAIDPVAGMSLGKVFDVVGDRLCLCGNVDCGLMLRGTPEQVHAAVVAQIRATQGRGFWVMGCTNAIQPDVPVANYRAYIKAVAGGGGTLNGLPVDLELPAH